uniref:Uncharacterized protein n=1 Tax=Tanacetum cinerariifolium TaxID=118510 RepID=A0A699K0X8_TANCI|nr:hypothetical protein [Tanacetum cinerariifolium]
MGSMAASSSLCCSCIILSSSSIKTNHPLKTKINTFSTRPTKNKLITKAIKEETKPKIKNSSPDEVTQKLGLEAGLWKIALDLEKPMKLTFSAYIRSLSP